MNRGHRFAHRLRRSFFGCAVGLWVAATAIAEPRGKPFLTSFLPAEYDAHQQNWDVAQGANGAIYVANSEAILAFDGARWEKVAGAPGQRFYAVHAGSDGRIYTGSGGDLGFLSRDRDGGTTVTSLLGGTSATVPEFQQIRAIEETPDGVFFLAKESLFRARGDGDLRAWPIASVDSEAGDPKWFRQLFAGGERLVVAVTGVGLMHLVEDRLELLPGSGALAPFDVRGIAAHPRGLWIATLDQGLFLYDGETVFAIPSPGSELAATSQVMGVARLDSGSYAVSTLSAGLLVLDGEGEVLQRVDHRSGLADNSVLNAGFTDSTGGVWVPLNNGLARLEIDGAFEYFDKESGLAGTVVRIRQHSGDLYAATTQGLFLLSSDAPIGSQLSPRTGPGRWDRVAGVPTFCWDLLSINSRLLIATGEGLFVHDPSLGTLERVAKGVIYSLARASATGEIYAATAADGLLSFVPTRTGLREASPFENIPKHLRRVATGPRDDLWLVAVEADRSETLVRVTVGSDGAEPNDPITYGPEEGLPARDQLQPFVWRDSLWVAGAASGLFRYDPATDRFEPPKEGALVAASSTGVEQFAVESTETLWLSPKRGPAFRVRWLGDEVKVDRPLVRDPARTLTTLFSAPAALWTATDAGRVIRYHEALDEPAPLPRPKLRAVFRAPAHPERSVRSASSLGTEIELTYDYRSVRFEFSLPSFDRPTGNSFQFRLHGLDEGWSSWTYETYRDYTGLREGSYRFDLRARDIYERPTEVLSAGFRILPPWYRTWGAYAVFVLLGAAALRGAFSFRQRQNENSVARLRAEISEREQVEQALRRKERMLSEAEQLALLGSWEMEPGSDAVRASDQFRRIYGFGDLEPITSETVLSRIHEEDREELQSRWIEAIKHRRRDAFEYRLEYAPGMFRTIYGDCQPIADETGRIVRLAGIIRDITDERAAQVALRASDERYRAFIRQSLEGMARFEIEPSLDTELPFAEQVERLYSDAVLAECNGAFARMYGVDSSEELAGSPLAHFSSPSEPGGRTWVEDFCSHNYEFNGELSELDRTGREREFQRTVTGIVEEGRLVRVWSTQRDIEERKRQERRLSYLASFDTLTALPNRFLFEDRLKQGLAQARRSGQKLAVHYLDLDNFKNVNDTLGHSMGDSLLKAVAERIQEAIRESDTVARLGGDEFGIVQLGVEKPRESVDALAEKVIKALAQPFELRGREIHTGASVGIAVSSPKARPEELMTQADTALHKAKEAGRGTYRFYSEEMAREVQVSVDLTRELRHAFERDELTLDYQPLVRLDDGECIGFEALVRWQHPERGRLLPGAFIPVAEHSGLITQLGHWVLSEACRQNGEWIANGLTPVPVSVNLSGVQFKQPQLGQQIVECLERSAMPPELLELELTETTLMSSRREVTEIFDQLRDRGIRLSIDDFGTGYSSLQYVSAFPVSKLKIAMEFVRGLVEEPRHRAIVEAVINLGNTLRIDVLAEGIETEMQANVLREIGCRFGQGFLYSRPLRPEDVVPWLESRVRSSGA